MAGGGSVMTRKVWPVRKKPSRGSLSGSRPDDSVGHLCAAHLDVAEEYRPAGLGLAVCLAASDLAPHPLDELDLSQDQGRDFAGLRLGGRWCWPGCRAGPGGGHGYAAGPLGLTGGAARGRGHGPPGRGSVWHAVAVGQFRPGFSDDLLSRSNSQTTPLPGTSKSPVRWS